jgi:chromate transporter
LFLGLAPAVLAIVVQAVTRIGRRALRHRVSVSIAVAAFVALAVFALPFPLVVLGAGVAGWLIDRWHPHLMVPAARPTETERSAPLIPDDELHRARPSWRRNAAILALGIPLWLTPVAAAAVLTGRHSVLTEQGVFFSGTALVTFGGAYAVLAFVAQKAVETYGWLTAGEMVKGLALAETTPGPLIMVVQFVAFVGAYRDPGGLDPVVAGVVASLLTTWVTFVPCFIFIFLGAPYVERLRDNAALSAALAGITAAVVGVIANLALYFATHTLFAQTRIHEWGPLRILEPVWSSYSWETWLIAVVAMVLIFALRWPVLRTLGACALLGVAIGLLT